MYIPGNGAPWTTETRLAAVLRQSPSTGAWHRELRRLLSLAGERRLELDEETLILSDVRDLQSMNMRLRHRGMAAGVTLPPIGTNHR